jgi:hypothetical protein
LPQASRRCRRSATAGSYPGTRTPEIIPFRRIVATPARYPPPFGTEDGDAGIHCSQFLQDAQAWRIPSKDLQCCLRRGRCNSRMCLMSWSTPANSAAGAPGTVAAPIVRTCDSQGAVAGRRAQRPSGAAGSNAICGRLPRPGLQRRMTRIRAPRTAMTPFPFQLRRRHVRTAETTVYQERCKIPSGSRLRIRQVLAFGGHGRAPERAHLRKSRSPVTTAASTALRACKLVRYQFCSLMSGA